MISYHMLDCPRTRGDILQLANVCRFWISKLGTACLCISMQLTLQRGSLISLFLNIAPFHCRSCTSTLLQTLSWPTLLSPSGLVSICQPFKRTGRCSEAWSSTCIRVWTLKCNLCLCQANRSTDTVSMSQNGKIRGIRRDTENEALPETRLC